MKEYNFRSGKHFEQKRDFGTIKPYFRGNISKHNESFKHEKTNFNTSYLQKQNRKNFLNVASWIVVCMPVIISCVRFEINQVILTLFPEVWEEAPPPPPLWKAWNDVDNMVEAKDDCPTWKSWWLSVVVVVVVSVAVKVTVAVVVVVVVTAVAIELVWWKSLTGAEEQNESIDAPDIRPLFQPLHNRTFFPSFKFRKKSCNKLFYCLSKISNWSAVNFHAYFDRLQSTFLF